MLFQLGQGHQEFYDGVCNRLDDQDLNNFSKVNDACREIVVRYDLSGRVSRIFAIPRDFAVRMCSYYDMELSQLNEQYFFDIFQSEMLKERKRRLALATNPSKILNRLTQLHNSPSRQTLLLKTSHIVLDQKTKYCYFRVNIMVLSLLNTMDQIVRQAKKNNLDIDLIEIMTSYVTELSKKKDQKRIPNSCIEDVIFSILSSHYEGIPPAFRGLIQIEIGKIEPQGDKDFDQTIEEFAEVLAQTFKDVEPLYNTLINFDKEIESVREEIEVIVAPAPAPAQANQGINPIVQEENARIDRIYKGFYFITVAALVTYVVYKKFF